MLLYDYFDGNLTWSLMTNALNGPESMSLRVFVTLSEQPLLFEVIPDQPWSPDTTSYTGCESSSI